MDQILPFAVAGALLAVLFIYVENRRTQGRDSLTASETSVFSPTQEIMRGMAILAIDFGIIVLVVNLFDLNSQEPMWENVFAFFVVGAIPVYGSIRILRGMYRLLFS